jgi:hypothetical protein
MTSRRNLLALTAGFGLAGMRAAHAFDSEIAKDEVGYQDVPRSGHVCAQCTYFVFKPAVNGVPHSRCKMVAGPINPAGWCEIWAPNTAAA